MTTLVKGTDFITVATRDIDAAEKFYTGALGLPLSKRWGKMPAAEWRLRRHRGRKLTSISQHHDPWPP
jgi:catechol 2,3-dioxygenase-like lactoylglutathione lyase family enzyme